MRLARVLLVGVLASLGALGCGSSEEDTGSSGGTSSRAESATPRLPAATPEERFDFWRVALEPGVHEGQERTCVTTRVDAIPDRERYLPAARRGAMDSYLLGCERGGVYRLETAAMTLIVPEGLEPTTVVRSERSPAGPDIEVRVRVRVLGLAPDRQTPYAELVSVERVPQEGDDDPTPPLPRCREDDVLDEAPAPGFEFREWREHLGSEQVCAVRYASAPTRVRAADHLPEGTELVMDAGCQGERGLSRVRLLFDDENARLALHVVEGARVEGLVGERSTLHVRRVTRATVEGPSCVRGQGPPADAIREAFGGMMPSLPDISSGMAPALPPGLITMRPTAATPLAATPMSATPQVATPMSAMAATPMAATPTE